tara:strand:- start:1381 stop:1569 length:189 start_codon:yes stop_codon:yes gene_type:complete
MDCLNLRTLHWSENGELISSDRLTVLNTLIHQSLPDVQMELIHTMENTCVQQRELTVQVSES